MARKTDIDVDLVESEGLELENLKPIRNVVRWISKQNLTNEEQQVYKASDVEDHLAGLVDLGYDLVNTHYIGEKESEAAYGIWYVLKLVPKTE